MNSAKLQSANKQPKTVYQQNQIKSICFLVLMAVILVLTSLLALRAGSYATPLNELIKGIFGLSGDDKINLVVRNNRLPRICTAIIAGAGLGLAGCIYRLFCGIRWLPHRRLAFHREQASAPRLRLLSLVWEIQWGWAYRCVLLWVPFWWR